MLAIITYKRDVESKDDHQLALLELERLSSVAPIELTRNEACKALGVRTLPFVTPGQRLFSIRVDVDVLKRLLRRLAFWDLVLVADSSEAEPSAIATGKAWARSKGVLVFATQTQIFELTAYAKDDPKIALALRDGHALDALIAQGNGGVDAAVNSPLTPISRRKNDYLTHGFHKYKAKFFPRLARSLINYTCPDDSGVVLDPYCGSGTTGVEASLMGMQALEFDIDPLSVFIANSKVLLGHLDLQKFRDAVATLPDQLSAVSGRALAKEDRYELPKFLLERNPKRLTADVLREIESEASSIKMLIRACQDTDTKALFELSFSHSLATKVTLRWMGTGDNRYSLEIAKRSLYSIFKSQLHYMVKKLGSWEALRKGGYVARYGRVAVQTSDCTSLPLAKGTVDAVVTSPPYLPAASGRETYLRSRATSLVGLGLMTEAAIHERERQIVGSIMAVPGGTVPLPQSVIDLVNWMQPQRERTSKAQPTAAYFEKLGESLKEMKRVLKPGGMVALVVSKEHLFYEMKTRKVLCRFSMVDAITELATDQKYGIGFELDRVQLLELPKMDFAARPGAQGTYSEAILFFRKPM